MEEYKQIGRPEFLPARVPVVIEPGQMSGIRPLAPPPGKSESEPESLFREYYRLLISRRWTILIFAGIGAVVAFGLCFVTTPLYRARTSLDIQSLNSEFMNIRAVAPTGQPIGGSSGDVYLQTQIKLLQSETLLNRTVQRMQSEANSVSESGQTPSSWMRDILRSTGLQAYSAQGLLAETAKSVTVKPLGLTRLVELTCDSSNAKFAADFCNTLTAEFQQQDQEVRWVEAQKTGEWLSRQLSDVRSQLRASEKKLQSAAESDGLLLQNNGSVSEQRLRELQTELMRAQADRVAKQAQYETSKSAPSDSLPSVLDDNQLRDFQTKLVDLQRQLAELVPPLTDAHPKVQHLKSQIKELEGSLAIKKANVIGRLRNEYEAARHREDLLTSSYLAQERKVGQELSRESQVSMLRRDVDSGQQIYQTLSQRVKEAGLASAMHASTIRVVDPALPPRIAILPRRGRSVVVGFVIGAIAGVFLAFFKERTQTVLRTPGEAPRFLNVRELGVIPSARVGLSHAYMQRMQKPSSAPAGLLTAPSSSLAGKSKADQVVDLATWKAHASLVAEAYRSTTYSILLEGRGFDRGKSYVISSPGAGEGKTTVTCNLGIALAQANRRVLVIDGDLRRPRLHKSMGISNDIGLRNMLRGEVDFETETIDGICQPTQIPNLYVLPSGSGSEEPSSLLYSSRLRPLLNRLTDDFDVVLMDTPPVLHLADARILAGVTDGVILVLRARSTDRENAMNARDLFQNDEVRVVGTILNDFDPMMQGQPDYYDSYYKYQETTGTGNTRRPA